MSIVKRRISCALFNGIGQQLQRCNTNLSEYQVYDGDEVFDG